MAKAKKLPSGNWRIRVYDYTDENGKIHMKSFTAETKAECEYMAADYNKNKNKKVEEHKETVREVLQKYIEINGPTLSPTTLNTYQMILRLAFQDIMDLSVEELNDDILQKAINNEMNRKPEKKSGTISAKTVKNEYGLIATALRHRCNRIYNVRLPKIARNISDLPDPRTIAQLLKGTDIELPCLLAMWTGMRMSEVRGLNCSSIRNHKAFIEQVTVTVNTLDITKSLAKTDQSIRQVMLPKYIETLIAKNENYIHYKQTKEDSPLISFSKDALYKRFTRLMQANGIKLSFHGLRHVFASTMLNSLAIPSKLVEISGGWSNGSTLNKVYSANIGSALADATKKRDDYFNSLFE